jgi:hypothetical protein
VASARRVRPQLVEDGGEVGDALSCEPGAGCAWRRDRGKINPTREAGTLGILAGYAAWMAALIIAHYTVPGGGAMTWALIGFTGVAAMVVGVVRYRPSRKLPWLVLALSNLCALAGQIIALVVTKKPLEDPSAPEATALYLLNYPLSVLGLVLIIRRRGCADGGIEEFPEFLDAALRAASSSSRSSRTSPVSSATWADKPST